MSADQRVAARVILLDPESRVLLFEGRAAERTDPTRWWFTVGGGVAPGESLLEAAHRELCEETGFAGLDLAGPFHLRRAVIQVDRDLVHQTEHYFAARTAATELSIAGWTDVERDAVTSWAWWSVADLAIADITYYPAELVELVGEASKLV